MSSARRAVDKIRRGQFKALAVGIASLRLPADRTPPNSAVDMPDGNGPALITVWRWWVGPALLSLALALAFLDPFAGEWDALDYTVLSVRGEPSSMILGRGLFIGLNHVLWLTAHTLLGLPLEKAYLLFKYAVVAQTPLAIIACWALARELTASVAAATIAALLLATSPFFIVYSGQVMTEIPAVLLLCVALTMHLRGVRQRRMWLVMAGAGLLGLSVNVRELALCYAPWLVLAPIACGWRLGRRELTLTGLACLVFLGCAFGGFALWWLADVGAYRSHWLEWVWSSQREAARHPVTLGNLRPLLLYFLLAAPLVAVAVPFAAVLEWRRARGLSPLLALALVGLFSDLVLLLHYSLPLNWRYLLTGLPALVPLVADFFMRSQTKLLGSERRAFVSVLLGVICISVLSSRLTWPISREYVAMRALTKDYRERLAVVPHDAVMISGSQSIAVNYWRGLGTGAWDAIGTGGGWPGAHLAASIDGYLKADRRVFLDTDARWWSPCGWQAAEVRELAAIEDSFRFRRVTDTIYELRPLTDASAHDDAAMLGKLLPESRPEEVKACSGAE